MNTELFHVAVEAPLLEPLTYAANPESPRPIRGQSVLVPLGKRQSRGVVLGPSAQSGEYQIKLIQGIDPDRPQLPEPYMKWLEWIAQYYVYPLGEVLSAVFPPLKKGGVGRKEKRLPLVPTPDSAQEPLSLNADQSHCVQRIESQPGFQVHLLHGVTGSGKTEVYLHLLKRIIEAGGSGLVLVPEISLTPQLIERFSARFPSQVAVLHSHLTERERTNQWWSAFGGDKRILVGARSALFCPLPNLQMIILDEEHEPSFKQDEKFRYHARDAAIALARDLNIPILLGSATPSLESWKNAQSGKYQLHEMRSRVAERQLPQTVVVDLRESKGQLKGDLPFWMSEELSRSLNENLLRREQSALFLNRRGVAQTALCESCGFTHECPNCSIGLTLHGRSHLVCHYCDYSEQLKERCPQCREGIIKPIGLGTELVEADLKRLFPAARIFRADRDEIQNREQLEAFVQSMAKGEIDILVGTQMIAKGLDFTGLTLVGLILADVGFHLPDFRASERSFQLITQMAGRSGRHSVDQGKVIVQTFNPDHPSVRYALSTDYAGFAEYELSLREPLGYPPFGRLIMVKIQGPKQDLSEQAASQAAHRARQLQQSYKAYAEVQVLGPSPAPLAKLRNQYRHQILIKAPDARVASAFARQLLGDSKWLPSSIKIQLDVDPMNMM